MPALAQTQPPVVSTISTPASARTTRRDSARTSSTIRGSLLQLGRQPAGALARRHLGQRSDTPLGLRDDLLGDDDDVAAARGEPRLGGRAGDQGAELRPGGDLRQAADRDDLQVGAHRRAPVERPSDARASAVCGARSGLRGERRREGLQVLGRVEVERRATRAAPGRPRARRARPGRGGGRSCRARTRGRSRRRAPAGGRWCRFRGGRGSRPRGRVPSGRARRRARRRRAAGSRRAAAPSTRRRATAPG